MEGAQIIPSPDVRWKWDGAAWRPSPYVSGAIRSAYATAFLVVLVLVHLIAAADQLFDASMFLFALSGGQSVGDADYATINAASISLNAVALACWVCAVIAFAMWLHRAAANLPALGATQLRFTPGWAVGWWFIPVANLVVPLLVIVEIWRASDPRQAATDRSARSQLPIGLTIPIWWLCWLAVIAAGVVGMFVGTAYTDQEKLVLFSVGAALSLATAACFALTLAVVRVLDGRQQRKYALMAWPAPTPAGAVASHNPPADSAPLPVSAPQLTVGDPGFTYPSPPPPR